MPLSDKEQQILQEIERHLQEQDPNFARGVATSLATTALRNLRIGIALFAVGFISLLVFFFTQFVAIGVLAFLIMLGGATFGYNSARKLTAEQIRAIRQGASFRKLFGPVDRRLKGFRDRND